MKSLLLLSDSGVTKEEEKESQTVKLLEVLITENVPNLANDKNL